MSSFIKTESLPETGHVIRKLVKMHRKKQANPYLLNPTLMLPICYLKAYSGFDEPLGTQWNKPDLTSTERGELADFMIQKWQEFKIR